MPCSQSARPNDFTFERDVDKIIFNRAGHRAKVRRTRPLDLHAFEQTHRAVHAKTEFCDRIFFDLFKSLDQACIHVSRQLTFHLPLPFRQHALQVKRRVKPLQLVREIEIEIHFATAGPLIQGGDRLTRIVIAVVIEEYDLPADFALQSSRRLDFRKQKTLRKNSAGLLPETNDGF